METYTYEEENRFDYETGSGEDLEPDVLEFMKKNTAENLGLLPDANEKEIDEAMKKKYL